ncbi:MAG: acyltransferase [Candidatus Micrarchaeia archaeon]|jgi:acetyltransferase-like isoleucine patch superfamily enzyme
MRKLQVHKTANPNSMADWWKAKNPLIVMWNFLLIWAAKYIPSLTARRVLLRLTGMKIGRNVGVGLGVTFDIFFPELIEIGDNCVLGYNATILAHEFLIGEWRTGRTKIGANTMVGANSTILAGVDIGKGSTISAMSLINTDVPAGSFFGGVPAKALKPARPNNQ